MKNILFILYILLLAVGGSAHATITPVANGYRNPKYPTGGTSGGVTFVSYGGTVAAYGDGVHDDTQAILECVNLNRDHPGNEAQRWDFAGVYIPSGTYNVSNMIVLRDPIEVIGEPSSPPTIVLTASSTFFQSASSYASTNPFVVFAGGWGITCGSYPFSQDWVSRDGSGYTSTNNNFSENIRDVNFTVDGSNPDCAYVFCFDVAQQCGMRNVTLTGTSQQTSILEIGDPPQVQNWQTAWQAAQSPEQYGSSGGGGGIIQNVTCTGNSAALTIGSQSYTVFRGCTFDGSCAITGGNSELLNFIGCTFDNTSGAGLSSNGPTLDLDDCVFTGATPFSPSTYYHVENLTMNGVVTAQETATPSSSGNQLYYNGSVVTSPTDSRLSATGVIKGSTYWNPSYPEPSTSTVDVTTLSGVDPTGATDSSTAINTALATSGESLYFPPGNYLCSSTINVGAGNSIYGSGAGSTITLNGTPGMAVTGRGSGAVVLCSMNVLGTVAWNGDQGSQVLDFHLGNSTNSTTCDIQSGGGLFEDCWWPADGSAQTGVTIESTDPLYLYSFAPEHYGTTPMSMTGAEQVYGRGLQYEVNGVGTPAQFLDISGGSNNDISGLITSGSISSSTTLVGGTDPQLSLWDSIVYNSSAPTQLIYSSTDYGSGSGGQVFSGFIIPSSPFLQGYIGKDSTGSNITSITASFPNQTAGNTNVIVVSYHSASVAMASSNPLVDTNGNTYSVASPLKAGGADSQIVYYCSSIAGSSSTNTVTATFASGVPYVSMRIAEYRGLGGIDVHSEGSGSTASTMASVTSATTTNANDIALAAVACSNGLNGTISGFMERLNATPLASDLQDDSPGSILSSFTASSPILSSTSWVENFVAFLPATATTPSAPGTLSTVGYSTPVTPLPLSTVKQ
jgi:hypothetical protein